MKLLLSLAAGFLGYCYYCGVNAKNRKGAVKEDLNRWEGEGGNVPAVATPSPAPLPRTSYPQGDDVVRH
ncbi:MAG TPA: hypothetical protein VNU21_23615 [Usitatibacter sp.]|jgi:hypothetical protein|nr:hypothetical protein [Usitatibacter sp.]